MSLTHNKQSATRLASKLSQYGWFSGVEAGGLVGKQLGLIVYAKYPPPKFSIPETFEDYPVLTVNESEQTHDEI